MRRPRVLFAIPDLRLGGAERVFISYVNRLKSVEPIVVLLRPELSLRDELRPDIPVFVLKESRGGPIPALGMAALRIRSIARRQDCRVVSTFLTKANLSALLAKKFLMPELRVVLNLHEHMSSQMHSLWPGELQRRGVLWFMRTLYPNADWVFSVTDEVRSDLERVLRRGLPAGITLGNVPDADWIRRQAALNEDETPGPLILAVGRLVALKGFDLLIRAFAQLPKSSGARLVVLGEGEEYESLLELARGLGVEDRVSLPRSRRNPWPLMARADLVVLSSKSEADPSVIHEAFCLGRPVLATDCSAQVRTLLANGERGALVPANDPKALAEAMQDLLEDDEARARLARAGADYAAGLRPDAASEVYESALRQLIERDPKTEPG